jgi:hypothetical protein
MPSFMGCLEGKSPPMILDIIRGICQQVDQTFWSTGYYFSMEDKVEKKILNYEWSRKKRIGSYG